MIVTLFVCPFVVFLLFHFALVSMPEVLHFCGSFNWNFCSSSCLVFCSKFCCIGFQLDMIVAYAITTGYWILFWHELNRNEGLVIKRLFESEQLIGFRKFSLLSLGYCIFSKKNLLTILVYQSKFCTFWIYTDGSRRDRQVNFDGADLIWWLCLGLQNGHKIGTQGDAVVQNSLCSAFFLSLHAQRFHPMSLEGNYKEIWNNPGGKRGFGDTGLIWA